MMEGGWRLRLPEVHMPTLDMWNLKEGLPLVPTLAVGGTTLVVWYIVSRWRQRSHYPPGPTPLPIVGNLHSLTSGNKKLWVVLRNMQEKYGDVFTIFLANTPVVLLGSLEMVREAFLTKQNDFAGRPKTFSFHLFSKGGKDIAMGDFGPVWKRQRKIAHEAFRKYATGKNLEELMQNSFERMSAELDEHVDTRIAFNPRNNLNMVIYDIIGAMVFGKQYEHDDPELLEFIAMIDRANDAFGTGLLADFIPIFKYVPTPALRVLKDMVQKLFKMVEDSYDEHVRTFEEGNPTDMVYHILQSIKDAEKAEGKVGTAGLTLDHYQMIILDIFSAGTDTSRFTLIWAVLFLSAFPECQDKIHEEVERVVGYGNPVQMEHRPLLSYTEAFLHEVMRIRPLAPLALPHETTCDTTVGGFSIPKGTQVMPNYWSIHMNEKEWGDPLVFRPERFLAVDGTMGPRLSSWLPFSTGRRVCVGEALAKAELHLLLSSICNRYHFAAPPGGTVSIECQTTGQIMAPDDYKVILSKRKPKA